MTWQLLVFNKLNGIASDDLTTAGVNKLNGIASDDLTTAGVNKLNGIASDDLTTAGVNKLNGIASDDLTAANVSELNGLLPQVTGGGYFHAKLNNSWWHLPRIMEWQICGVHFFFFWLVGVCFSGSVFSLIVTTLSFDSKGGRFPERLLFVGQVCLCACLVDWLLGLLITQLIFLTSKRDQTLIMHARLSGSLD